MALTKILSFYYKRGSLDCPSNIDPNAPFGWDRDADTAVFKYSINDVEKSFNTVREFTQPANYNATSSAFLGDSTGGTNVLLVEAGKTDEFDYTQISTESPEDRFWQDVFRCVEFLGRNQASVTDSPWNSQFSVYGDCALGSATDSTGAVNPYYVDNYVKGSLTYQKRASSSRLSWVQFSVTSTTYGTVTIQTYFDADAWCERSASVAYKVWRYEDSDGDSTISQSEMDKQIVNKIFDILNEGKYKSYSTKIIDKRISDTTTTTEQFFIFSTIKSVMTDDKMKEEIKEYLMDKYDNDTAYLRYTYPLLFDENEIRLIPIWDNQLTQNDGNSKDMHAISIDKISKVLSNYGYSISSASTDYRPSEVFYLGPGAGWSPTVHINFVLPIIAVEQDTTSGIQYPISSRFPDYKPIYGQNESGVSAEFHFVLLQIINYLNNNTALESEFKAAYSISESSTNSGNRKVVTFVFANDVWTIYGKAGSANQ